MNRFVAATALAPSGLLGSHGAGFARVAASVRFFPVALIASIGCALWPGAASTHAMLTSATPAVGSTVTSAPGEVVITFSEGVEPRFSKIAVLDAAGGQVVSGGVHSGSGQKQLAIGLKPLPPGTYKVVWHATSVDTHKTQGSFSFTVKP